MTCRTPPSVARGHRARFRKLSRIYMRCGEPQAASRLKEAFTLVNDEYKIARSRSDMRMRMTIAGSILRTDR